MTQRVASLVGHLGLLDLQLLGRSLCLAMKYKVCHHGAG